MVKNYEDNFFNKTKLKYNEKIIEESIDDLSGLWNKKKIMGK